MSRFFQNYDCENLGLDLGFSMKSPDIDYNIPKDKKTYNKTHFIVTGGLNRKIIYYKMEYILKFLICYLLEEDSNNNNIESTFNKTNATWNIIYSENNISCELMIFVYDILKYNKNSFFQDSSKYLFEFFFISGDNFLFYKLFYFILHKFTDKFEQYIPEK